MAAADMAHAPPLTSHRRGLEAEVAQLRAALEQGEAEK